MAQGRQGPPAGPKASRTSANAISSRTPTRGGIQKRNSPAPRVDRDGDLVMSAATRDKMDGRGRGRGRSTKGPIENPLSKRSSRPARGGIDHASLQQSVLRGMGVSIPPPNGPRSTLRTVRERGPGNGAREALEEISVNGLKQSKAVGNSDGGIQDLITFLERKSTNQDALTKEPVKIKKSRLEEDVLVISVRSRDSHRILQLNNFMFAGAKLDIKPHARNSSASKGSVAHNSSDEEKRSLVSAFKAVIKNRYDEISKILDLSRLGSDPELVGMGMFETTSTGSKLFPALMKIIDEEIPDARSKEEAISSISLADNNLPNASSVATLAQTFPALRNLDLSNNRFEDLSAFTAWRRKLPKLDHLILSGNPVENQILTDKEELLRIFPRLTKFNNIQIRAPEDIKAAPKGDLPIPILQPSFRDEGSIGKTFIQTFFPLYDSDRSNLIANFYDAQSTFSLSINTSAPRAHDSTSQQTPKWDSYIKRSRNLMKLNQLPARMNRLYRGSENIREIFTALPASHHPNVNEELHKWCLECHAIPGLPDPTGQSSSGVGGLIVTAHGEFSEVNVAAGETTTTRSFDRTFVLGPGSGAAGIRLCSDSLVLRAYGGHGAWQPDVSDRSQQLPQNPVPGGFALSAPGKPIEQVQKEITTVELSKTTGLTLEYSQMCLEQSNWNLENALLAFKQAMATEGGLPPQCFVASLG